MDRRSLTEKKPSRTVLSTRYLKESPTLFSVRVLHLVVVEQLAVCCVGTRVVRLFLSFFSLNPLRLQVLQRLEVTTVLDRRTQSPGRQLKVLAASDRLKCFCGVKRSAAALHLGRECAVLVADYCVRGQ